MKDAGFYSPGDSWLHRTHAAPKIFVFIAAVALIPLFFDGWQAHMALIAGLGLIVASARVRRRQLLLFSPAVPLVFLTGLSWLVFANEPTGPVAAEFRLGPFEYALREETAESAAAASLRTIIWVLAFVALLTTTTSRDLVSGMRTLGVPTLVARAVGMTLRFWATVMGDTGRVVDAQRARGVDFDQGSRWRGLSRRVVSTTMPTLFLMLKRFQTLNFALSLRAVGAKGKKTRLYAPPLKAWDWTFGALAVTLLALLWLADKGALGMFV